MCEIIVKAVDVTHSDPVKDRRGCYKRGYPVAVYPDGTRWGNEERLPKFVIIKIPGVPVDHPLVQKYIGQHEEPRQQTLKWNKLEWEKRQGTGEYYPFLSVPTVLGESSEVKTITIRIVNWLKQSAVGDYFPFYTEPTILSIEGDNYQIQGTVVSVDLQGDVMTVITRRLWKIRFADLPLAARNKLASSGELVIKVGTYAGTYDYTWTQVKGYFRNLKTGLDETVDL
jgi:hypothetical protein